ARPPACRPAPARCSSRSPTRWRAARTDLPPPPAPTARDAHRSRKGPRPSSDRTGLVRRPPTCGGSWTSLGLPDCRFFHDSARACTTRCVRRSPITCSQQGCQSSVRRCVSSRYPHFAPPRSRVRCRKSAGSFHETPVERDPGGGDRPAPTASPHCSPLAPPCADLQRRREVARFFGANRVDCGEKWGTVVTSGAKGSSVVGFVWRRALSGRWEPCFWAPTRPSSTTRGG